MKRFIERWLDRRARPPAAQALLPALDDDVLCRLPAPLPLSDARRALVFAPHPDDESIGCGGLIARLVDARVPVRVVLVTDGGGAGGLAPGAAAERQQEFRRAVAQLGSDETRLLGFVDGGLRPGPALDAAVLGELRDWGPDWVVMPALDDLHRDHRVLADSVRRMARGCAAVRALWQYETWAAQPVSHVLDISAVLGRKRAAIAEHHTALACGNYLEGALGLAAYRGLLLGASRPGSAAEGFLACPID
ncbi:MAG: PIG-L deacetylase family protein [Rubrivivax sp.]